MRARPIIAEVLRETEGLPEKEIRQALTAAYPFGERRMWPYKAWLAEVRAQRLGPRRIVEPTPTGQLVLLEEAA